jgi:hypothetical protein
MCSLQTLLFFIALVSLTFQPLNCAKTTRGVVQYTLPDMVLFHTSSYIYNGNKPLKGNMALMDNALVCIIEKHLK